MGLGFGHRSSRRERRRDSRRYGDRRAWPCAPARGDTHIYRARLFRDKEELKRARALIEQCGYWRRKEEFEDAEEAAKEW